MAKKDKEQSKRFIEKAKELEADETESTFKAAFDKIISKTKSVENSNSQNKKGNARQGDSV